MDLYYRDRFGRRQGDNDGEDKRTPIWLTIIDIVAAIISLVVIVALIVIFAGQFVSPEKLWYFSLAALAAPLFYITAVAMMLYWIIRWKWIMAVTLAIFVAGGLVYVPLYYRVNLSKTYEDAKPNRNDIKVLTFNLRHLHQDNWQPSIDSVAVLVEQLNPDIICFQEYPASGELRRQADSIMRAYNASSAQSIIERSDCAVECFSHYDIIAADSIGGIQGSGVGMWADVKIDSDTVRVYCIHLQTTSVSPTDNNYITKREFISDTTREKRFRDMARGLLDNNKIRAQQADCIARYTNECSHPIILCGDFNDVPMSYTYRTISRGLYDTFSRKGHHYAHSYRGMFNMLRIDYIMVSPRFETVAYDIPATNISDHRPVTATLRLTQN